MKFAQRHIGISPNELNELLNEIKVKNMDELISETVPAKLLSPERLQIGEAMSEQEYLIHIKEIGKKNKVFKTYIGMGYNDTITPSVILRNVFENPGWYTQYTPYQAEIAQGRLESLLNYQTMIIDLTGLPIANASLLDESTAGGEVMTMFHAAKNKTSTTSNIFFVDDSVFPQTKAVIKTKAELLGIVIEEGDALTHSFNENYFAVLVQNPRLNGDLKDYTYKFSELKSKGIYTAVVADIMSLLLVKSPGAIWCANWFWGSVCGFLCYYRRI